MPYAATNLLTLRNRLKDRYDSTPFWSDTEANSTLNETLRWFNLFTGYWRGTSTVNTVANNPFLTVPGTLTKQTRVTRAGKVLTLKSIVEFYRQRRGWRTQTTASGGSVPTTIREWAPIGLGSIAIWPADAAGGTTLTFEGVKITPLLVADGDFLDLGDEEITLILDETLYLLAIKRPSLLAALKPRHQAFLQGCVERNDQLRSSAFFREALGLPHEQRLLPVRRQQDQPEEIPS